MNKPIEREYSAKLSTEQRLELLWWMLLSRRCDERAWILHRQNKIAFHVSAIGHEATQVGTAYAMNRGVDYAHPYYRDLPMCLTLGITPEQFMLGLFGKQGELSSGARQMPSHFSSTELNIFSISSPVTSQVPQAVGSAFAIQYRLNQNMIDPDDYSQPRLSLTSLGEGSTNQGDWHEGLNWAGVHKLPFICLVQNNSYAISVPQEQQMAVANVADRAAAYGLVGVVVDGNDVEAVYDAMKAAAERAYRGDGPTLVEAKTYRLAPHSSDDDDRSYRSREEVEEWKAKDPILLYQQKLMDEGILTQEMIDDYEARIKKTVDDAHKVAENAPHPPGEAALGDVYAPQEDV